MMLNLQVTLDATLGVSHLRSKVDSLIPTPNTEQYRHDESLALERKIESRKRNFSLDLENLIVPISLSTLDFREWQETILFLLSIFESGKNKFSFHSRFSRVERKNSLSTLDFREFDTETLVFSLDF